MSRLGAAAAVAPLVADISSEVISLTYATVTSTEDNFTPFFILQKIKRIRFIYLIQLKNRFKKSYE